MTDSCRSCGGSLRSGGTYCPHLCANRATAEARTGKRKMIRAWAHPCVECGVVLGLGGSVTCSDACSAAREARMRRIYREYREAAGRPLGRPRGRVAARSREGAS